PISASDYGSPGEAISKAETRTEVPVLAQIKVRHFARIRPKHRSFRIEIESESAGDAVDLVRLSGYVPAQAAIPCQIRRCLPVVRKVEAVTPLADGGDRHAFGRQSSARIAQHERGRGKPTNVAGEGDVRERPVVGSRVVHQPADVTAEFERVAVAD